MIRDSFKLTEMLQDKHPCILHTTLKERKIYFLLGFSSHSEIVLLRKHALIPLLGTHLKTIALSSPSLLGVHYDGNKNNLIYRVVRNFEIMHAE